MSTVVGLSRHMSSLDDFIGVGFRRRRIFRERDCTQESDLYSFSLRETSSGNSPTCCLWLDLITYAGERVADAGALSVLLSLVY